ncbi:MAG: hypothetical protein GYA24_25330 [Candidatus Lokiarchaeota archaeon]|nr:hypothetical protein [Candidatus Lokiarchaeota archaeon]
MDNLEALKAKALALLKDFKGALEIPDFKKFLLVNFSSHAASGPAGFMSMLGMGESTGLTLSYDPMRNLYYHKVLGATPELSQLFLYSKHEPIMKEKDKDFFTKDPVAVLKEYLTPKELELLGIGTKRKKLVHVKAAEFQLLDSMHGNGSKEIQLGIDMVYANLESFIAGYEPRSRVFFLKGVDGDLLFDVNFTPLTKKDGVNLVTFDVYLDETNEIGKHAYIAMDQDSKIKFIDEIKDTNVQNTLYCLVVPVASFTVP